MNWAGRLQAHTLSEIIAATQTLTLEWKSSRGWCIPLHAGIFFYSHDVTEISASVILDIWFISALKPFEILVGLDGALSWTSARRKSPWMQSDVRGSHHRKQERDFDLCQFCRSDLLIQDVTINSTSIVSLVNSSSWTLLTHRDKARSCPAAIGSVCSVPVEIIT